MMEHYTDNDSDAVREKRVEREGRMSEKPFGRFQRS